MAPVFVCGECAESFTREDNYDRHNEVHNSNPQCSCQHCNFKTTRKDSLKRHVEKFHQDIVSVPAPITENDQKIDNLMHVSSQMKAMYGEFDGRLQLPHNFIYAGASQSGKTSLLMKTLQNVSKMYNPVPTRIFFFYSCFQEIYTKLRKQLKDQGVKCDFVKGDVVTETDLEAMADPNGGQTLIIIDDNSISAIYSSSKEMAHVFTMARHKNCSIVLLLHFIFGPWPTSRIISANTAYFFLLKSPRMAKQIATLGSQLGKQRALVSAYEREAKKRYGYVLVDLCTTTPEHLRIRTDIFNEVVENKTEAVLQPTRDEAPPTEHPVTVKDKETVAKPKRKWITWTELPPKKKK